MKEGCTVWKKRKSWLQTIVFLVVITLPASVTAAPYPSIVGRFHCTDTDVSLTVVTTEAGELSELRVDAEVVMRLRATHGGLSPSERGAIVFKRLQELALVPDQLAMIKPELRGKQMVVAAGDRVLVTVDAHTALANTSSRWQLATTWAENLRRAYQVSPIQETRPVTATVNARIASIDTMVASWYGDKFAGRRTASGEIFDPAMLTAAHRSLPFGTLLEITYPRTGRTTVVRVNDRGPFTRGRDLDLSEAAARHLGLLARGVDRVQVSILSGR